MQEILLYVSAASPVGVYTDYLNVKKVYPPMLIRGCNTRLMIRIFANKEGTTPYPIETFSSVDTWYFAMDDDYDSTSSPIISVTSGISVTQVNGGYTQFSVPLLDMNTAQLAEWLGSNKERDGLNAELVGRDSSGKNVFVLQLENFTVRNRIIAP